MKKNYSLILIIFLCFVLSGYGQIVTFDFNGLAGNEVSATSNFNNPNLNSSIITRGTGLNATNNANRFNADNWALTNIANAIAGNNYMEFTITPNLSYQFDVTSIIVNFERSGQGPRGILLRSSLDGYTTDIDTEKVIADITTTQSFTFTVGQTNNTAAVTYRIYGWAEATGGTGGFEGLGNDIIVNGSVNSICTDAVDLERLYFITVPPTIITQGDPLVVRTIATEPFVTDLSGEAIGIEAWIGYSTTNNDPSTSSGWTWISATYAGDVGGNDIHIADIGPGLAPGTYYYATRHRLNGCVFTYGGVLGPYWSNDSQVVTVNPAPLADVVITEIMYNTTGVDDEWIEICNVSGSPQALNSYTIEVGGTTEFTFPNSGVVLADGDCITIALGEDTANPVFNPDCAFTPDYTNGAGTGTLNNTSDTISLIASDGTSVIDEVTYNSADGGNTDSLHVVDTTLDNSDTSSNYWEVINGGSPGVNSLISPCTPVGPEINVEGNTGNFPDISNGDITPSIFDGTNFGDLGVGSAIVNEFRIENFAGTQNLDISSVTVLSGDTADFSITALPASPIAPANPNGFSIFEIEFQPTVPGTRTAVIQIISNDGDENPYTFTVTGNGLCVANAITALPASGPAGTVVIVTGTDLDTATASFNSLPATVNNISATNMEVTVPAGATSGNLVIIDSNGCPGITPFTVIDSEISSCEGSGGTLPTDLFISEVTDATLGGLTYVELYNGTGADINIDNYSIEVIANGAASAAAFNILDLENIIVANGSTYVIAIGRSTPVDATNACTTVTGGSGELASSVNAQFTNGGINKRLNEHDVIRLVNSGITVDEFGVYQDNDWMDSTIVTGDRGFNFRRLNTATTLPDPTFTLAELGNWTVIDWIGSGAGSCSGNDYSNIGQFDFSTGIPPVVNSILATSTACNESTITVSANEGFSGGNMLEYHWYYYNPAQSGLGWQTITNGGIYTTATNSPNLVISDASSVADHQFYCEVREDNTSCYSASNAVGITLSTATWDGTDWNWTDGTAQNTIPTLLNYANVIINGNYNTAIGGFQTSFEACDCTVNAGTGPPFNTLTIENNTYVLVENDLTVNGNIVVKTNGSFVQVNDAGAVDGDVLTDKTKISVEKQTAPLATFREYTYWSSPVAGEIISDGLLEADPNRIFSFSGADFRDSTQETNNNDGTVAGQDDIDDNADDWQFVTGGTTMLPGVGYASTHNPVIFINPGQYIYIFEGPFNNGIFNVPIYRDDAELNDNNWNFIGNPYPSAIDADLFLAANASIDQSAGDGAITGAIFFWSHNTAADGNTNGNEDLNYSQSDYAIINGAGETAGGDGVTPTRHIPSGQGFFISMDNAAPSAPAGGTIRTTDIVFNNSMRITGNNNQFFRNSNNKLWLNLTSDNGVFNQILVAYVNGATDGDDGAYYDAQKNFSSELYSGIYSLINNSTDKKFAIQAKDPNSLTTDETIPIGFNTVIDNPTIYTLSVHQFEGPFMNENDIFVVDHLLNSIHNLKESDYNFTSDKGEFNERFDIVFTPQALSVKDNVINTNDLTISELANGDVKIKISANLTITSVEILDILGRSIYALDGNSSTEVYTLSGLSKAAYIAKVTLSNGQVISKKAIKQR